MLTTRSKKLITEAPKVWQHLNGIINLYKPAGVSMRKVQLMIATNICRDLNQMEVRPPREIVKIEAVSGGSGYIVKQEESLADNTLVVGERYQPVDIRSVCGIHLGRFTSGVMSINRGKSIAHKIRENRPIRVYHVTGRFGSSTETHFNDSAVTVRASFDHVNFAKINAFLASLQASHQKKMFEMCGVDIQSQTAYELACQGPLRPSVSDVPLIYSLRCIDLRRPYFTIEIHAINESEAYLGILIHEIALHLKTVAHCTQIRCIRQAHFTLEDTLLRRHWNIENILGNMTRCQNLLDLHPEMLRQLQATLFEASKE